MKEMMMKKAAMQMLSDLSNLDISKAKAVSVSVIMDKQGMHKMPDGSMMKDSDMEEDYGSEESSAEYCSDCGDKMEDGMCKSCGYKKKQMKKEAMYEE